MNKTSSLYFLASFVFTFLICNVLWIGMVTLQTGTPSATSYFQTLQLERKNQVASDRPTPRLIISSASGSMFGLRTQLLEKGLGLPVLNLGMSGNFGIPGLLHYARKYARPKDTILLAFEYALYDWDAYAQPNAETLDFLFAIAPEFLTEYSISDQLRFMYTLPFSRVCEGLNAKYKILPPKTYKNQGARYPIETLNAFGEVVGAPLDPMALTRQQLVFSSPPTQDVLNGIQQTTNLKVLEKFIAEARRDGIKVLAAHPPYYRFPNRSLKDFKMISDRDHFYQAMGVPDVNRAEDEFWDKEYIFDDVYHLTEAGAEQRSKNLVAALKPYLGELMLADKEARKNLRQLSGLPEQNKSPELIYSTATH